MDAHWFQVVLALLYFQIEHGHFQGNNTFKSGIVDDYESGHGTTHGPGRDYSFFDSLDERGRILFITGTCALGIILFTLLACYCRNNACSISCKTPPPPLVNMVTVNLTDGIPEQSEAAVATSIQVTSSRSPSPMPLGRDSGAQFTRPVRSCSQHDISVHLETSHHPTPSHTLWRSHSTGRMPKAQPGTAGLLPHNQGLGNLSARFCASTGHLHPGHSPLVYAAEGHHSQGNPSLQTPLQFPQSFLLPHSTTVLGNPSAQPSLQDPRASGFPVPLAPQQGPVPEALPTITVQSPTPPTKRMNTMSRWHSDSNLAAETGRARQFHSDVPSPGLQTLHGGQLWRCSSVGMLFPSHPDLPVVPPPTDMATGERPSLGATSYQVQPSAPPLDLL